MDLAEFERGEILPHPQQRLSCPQPQGKPQGKSRRCPAVAGLVRKHLVQGALGEAAAQRLVCPDMAKRHAHLPVPKAGFG